MGAQMYDNPLITGLHNRFLDLRIVRHHSRRCTRCRAQSGHQSGHDNGTTDTLQMARGLNLLTSRKVTSLKEPGRHADGGGLYLRITSAGSRSWVFMTMINGKRQEIGLGPASALSLAGAREIAVRMREVTAVGGSPRQVLDSLQPEAETKIPTFGVFANEYITTIEEGWKNPVHRQQWRNTLRDHASALSDLPIDVIATDHLLEVLKPIWLTKSETARRLRGRIERILDAAKVRGLRSRDAMNPATLRGHLALLLPAQSRLQRGHHAAMSSQEVPRFFAELQQRSAMAARCLEFTILTAARSGEALGATWGEVDIERLLWTVPPVRMKAGVEHTVPLSGVAVELLRTLRPAEPKPGDRIFTVAGAARSNMAMSMLLRRMGRGDVTVHGFRSTFRDWAGDRTSFPREIVEHALAHTIQNKAERAYRRGTALERRRELMNAYADFLTSVEPEPDTRGL
jgi:integrase